MPRANPNTTTQKLFKKWKEEGGVLPPAKEQKRLKRAYIKARRELERVKLEVKRLEAEAEQSLSASARACVEAFGNTPLLIDGDIYDPVCRGDIVYYRKRNRPPEPEAI